MLNNSLLQNCSIIVFDHENQKPIKVCNQSSILRWWLNGLTNQVLFLIISVYSTKPTYIFDGSQKSHSTVKFIGQTFCATRSKIQF